jgi:hypothetical protein
VPRFVTPAVTALLALAALYLTVWPHELGHSAVARLYGCKADFWRTDTHWYLAGSQAGDIDAKCLQRQGGGAFGFMAIAGTAVNLLLILLAPLLGRWWLPGRPGLRLSGEATSRSQSMGKRAGQTEPGPRWGLIATLFWALANAAEALSYLVINTLWLKNDMAIVVREAGLGPLPWTAAGLLLAALLARSLRSPLRKAAAALAASRNSERLWRWLFRGYFLAVAAAAVASRALVS